MDKNIYSTTMNFLGHYYLHTEAFWVIRGGLTSLFCAVRLWWAVPHSTIHFSFCLLSVSVLSWFCLDRDACYFRWGAQSLYENTEFVECRFWSAQWILVHAGIWAQIWWFSLHMSCWYPQLEFCWQQSAKMLYKSASSSLPSLFPNLLCWWKKKKRQWNHK